MLGQHVQQRGSLVDAERTRFDFAHDAPLTAEQIAEVERLVNAEILANHEVAVRNMPYEEAVEGGAMALFGEKYDDVVRVLDIGFSRELCGGTHVQRTGDIGLFKIISESGVAAGVRRVEAITGNRAFQWMVNTHNTLQQAASLVSATGHAGRAHEALQAGTYARARARSTTKQARLARGSELIDRPLHCPAMPLLVAAVKVSTLKVCGHGRPGQRQAQVGGGMLASVLTVGSTWWLKHDPLIKSAGELVTGPSGGGKGGRPDMAMGGNSLRLAGSA